MREDFPWGKDGFRLKNIRIRPTVRQKTEKTLMILETILCIIVHKMILQIQIIFHLRTLSKNQKILSSLKISAPTTKQFRRSKGTQIQTNIY